MLKELNCISWSLNNLNVDPNKILGDEIQEEVDDSLGMS